MSEESQTWKSIRAMRVRLRDEFNVDGDELLRGLSDKSVFTHLEERRIRDITDPKKRFDELFDELFKKNPQKHIESFLKTLTEMGRGDVVRVLQGKGI